MLARSKRTALVIVVFFLSLVVFPATAVMAQDDATTVTIHKAECPAGYTGGDPFTDCHENRVAGVTFQWGFLDPVPPQEVTTDADGVATITTSMRGFVLKEVLPYDIASFSVFCSTDDGTAAVPFVYLEGQVGISFQIGVLDGISSVVCDWYNVPVGTGDAGSKSDTGATTTLPSTGVGPATGSDGSFLIVVAAAGLGAFAFAQRPRSHR